MNKEKTTVSAKQIAIGFLVIGIILVGLYASGRNQINKNTLKDEPKQTVRADNNDTSDLKLAVQTNTEQVKISSSESMDLENCEVRLNSGAISNGYTAKISIPSNQEVVIPLISFKKDQDAFNNQTTSIKTVTVALCKDNEYRRASFTY